MAKINQKISSIGISTKISLGLMDQEVLKRRCGDESDRYDRIIEF